MVVPQPSGAVGVQPTTSLTVTPNDSDATNFSPPQPPPSNSSVNVRPNIGHPNLRIPHVATPPAITPGAAKRPSTVPNVQRNSREIVIAVITSRFSASTEVILSMVSPQEV